MNRLFTALPSPSSFYIYRAALHFQYQTLCYRNFILLYSCYKPNNSSFHFIRSLLEETTVLHKFQIPCLKNVTALQRFNALNEQAVKANKMLPVNIKEKNE